VEFNSSAKSTVGIEVEYGIVDRETGELVPVSSEILAEAGAKYPGGEHPKAKNELFQPSIEVITGICETPKEAAYDLAGTLGEIVPLLNERGLALESTGTHPFAEWDELPTTPNPRYDRMLERLQWPAQRLLIHGIHVHVGVRSGDKAVITTNVLAMYLPVILALSASSPYWLGRDTGMASSRTKVFEAMPTTGVPPQLADWDDYNQLLTALMRAGTIESVKEIWWDIRPHPDFGTVELRMCDGITTLRETATVAAIAQAMVTKIDEMVDAGETFELLPDWVLRENKWRASRWGLDAELIRDRLGATQPLREQLREVIDFLTPTAEKLGCVEELRHALTMAEEGSSYLRQRAVVAAGGSLVDVVKELLKETDASFVSYDVLGAVQAVELDGSAP